MRYVFVVLMVLISLAGCTGAETTPITTAAPIPTDMETPSSLEATPTVQAASPSVESSPTAALEDDFFTQMGITLPAPACAGLTQPQMEGPYYKADTPERTVLFEEGMPGTRLILAGYVLDQNCQPLPEAWLDFWQADANGEYDNTGYRLRGHQFTDAQGRYYLDTVLPGLYLSRPIEHIHVKVRLEGGQEITTQLYFPQQPVEGLTVTLEERSDFLAGYFNFVVQR
jgi:protocatechuate 3,4-dioxygenase beta subunit